MTWSTQDALVGKHVVIITGYGEEEHAVVLAVATKSTLIRVQTDDGDILIGNTWEEH